MTTNNALPERLVAYDYERGATVETPPDGSGLSMCYVPTSMGATIEEAREIARRYNAFPAMLEALQDAESDLVGFLAGDWTGYSAFEAIIDQLRAALAQAQEGTE